MNKYRKPYQYYCVSKMKNSCGLWKRPGSTSSELSETIHFIFMKTRGRNTIQNSRKSNKQNTSVTWEFHRTVLQSFLEPHVPQHEIQVKKHNGS